jgi:hypothetical protein
MYVYTIYTRPLSVQAQYSRSYINMIASGRPEQKTPFPNNSSVVIDVCLSRRCIETAVILLLCVCSFPLDHVYRVVA